MKDAKALYNSIINGDISVESLTDGEKDLIFGLLCEKLEKGEAINRDIFEFCGANTSVPKKLTADRIINRTYDRINESAKHTNIPCAVFKRLLIAALAVLTFVVSSFITASALKVDIVESVKTIISGEKQQFIVYEDRNRLDLNGKYSITNYETADELFKTELPEALYPAYLPENARIYKVTYMCEEYEDLFQIHIKTDGEDWVIIAKEEEKGYIPMGYKYTATDGEKSLDFVYTVSRKDSEITKYNVYTVYNGIHYTFYLNTGDWEEVKTLLNSTLF